MSAPTPPDELRALLELEREAWVEPDAATRARLAARLDLALGGPPDVAEPKAPSVRTPRLPWGAATGLVAAGFGAGALVHSWVTTPVERVEVRYVDRVVEVPVEVPVEVQPTPPPQVEEAPASRPALPLPAPVVRDHDLVAESLLLERARSALTRGDAEGALEAAREHARRFQQGELAEAREALSVEALVQAGRAAEARARGKRFHAQHPDSPYAPVVDAALGTLP